MALVRQVNLDSDIGLYWLNQYNLFLNNIGYIGRDDAQLYYTETASANRLTRTESSGRLNFSLIPSRTYNGMLQIIQASAASPSLHFEGDAGTGIYSPGDNQVAIATNGIQGLLIDSTQSMTISGDLNVNGGDINTTAPTFNLLVNATTVNLGATNSTLRVGSSLLGAASLSVFNTTSTTVDAFGAATTLNIGNATAPQALNLGAGVVSTGTKTVNIGTGGSGSSVTNVTLGANTSGSRVNVNSPEFRINNIASTRCASTTVTGTSATIVHTFPTQQFKSAVYQIEVYNGQNFYSSNMHVAHNGEGSTTLTSDVYYNEYSVLAAGVNPVASISAQLASVGGNVNIVVQQSIAGTSQVRIVAKHVMF